MSGASQQKKKEGNKGKRQTTPATKSAEHGNSAGSAAAGHSVGQRSRSDEAHRGAGGSGTGDDSPPGKGTFDAT